MSSLTTLLDQAAAVECPPDIRNRIMDGALTCVKRWGIEKTSLNDIAREAGCARQTVYNYYGSRDGVVLAALLESSRQFAERLQEHVCTFHGAPDRLTEALLFCFLELPKEPYLQMLTDPELSPLANQEVFNSELCLGLITQVARALLDETPQLLDQAQEIGEIMTRILLSFLLVQGPVQRTPAELRALIRKRFLPGLLVQ
jgi:AcrR family transcriptional regulator